ncbi:glutamate receptor ionotropic, kainate 2-like [Bradysia coprophila]|uniref:glutamate receptor ionotropic, kainate 2-like n=1 Tax=Bradysia coprophila TaxID=38358 RepID=UPI00187DAA60|nr:glutamate receptor ionotropic, kainate 2-like [Bradysia coprophila]
MIFLNYFIAFFHICSFAYGYGGIPVRIGGIFTETNSDLETVFRNALDRKNSENHRFQFIPLVHRVDPDDSFGAEKIACELASDGVVAIFGPNSIQTSKIVGSVCNELGIPHILSNWSPGEVRDAAMQHAYTLNFFPENNLFAQALAQIIDDYEWNGFTLLYDNNESLERLQDVLENHGPDDNAITILQLPEDEDYQPILKFIETSQENHIVIDCEPEKAIKIFKQAFGVKMMEEYQSYIITSLDSHFLDYKELGFFRANITAIRLMDPLSEEVREAVTNWQQAERGRRGYTGIYADRIKTETALFYDAVQTFLVVFNESNAAVPIRSHQSNCRQNDKWNQGLQLVKALKEKTHRGMSGRICFDNDGHRTDFHMEVLELNKEVGFKKIAILDPLTMKIAYTRTSAEVFSQVTQSLQNKTVIVASIIGAPFLTRRIAKEGEKLEGNEEFEGYSKDVIETLALNIKFSYKLELVDDNKQGSYDKKTKKWNGLVKRLLDRKADLAICDLTITYERRTQVDFTMPFMTLGISILYAKPHKEPPDLFSFMSPLSLSVWIYMATAYLCISVLLFFLAKTAADDWENPHPCNTDPDELETIWNMHNCIWLTAGSIMQQGCDILPKAISTRLAAGLWWFFALIVISSYTANLAAFLTMERMEASIESAEDLAKQSKIKYGGVKDGSTMAFFKKSNFSTYQRMWAAMESAEPSVFAQNNEEGVDRVKRGNRMYAFLMESTLIEYHSNRNCNLTQVGGLLDSKGYGIAMPVNSPYRSLISEAVLKLQEDGTLQRLKTKWWKDENLKVNCDEGKQGATATPELGMANVGGVFLVLACGLGVSILIGILEFLWNVSKVSVAEKITQWEAFKAEVLFALDIRITTKPVNKAPSERSRSVSNRSSKSLEADQAIVPGWRFNLEEKQRNKA